MKRPCPQGSPPHANSLLQALEDNFDFIFSVYRVFLNRASVAENASNIFGESVGDACCDLCLASLWLSQVWVPVFADRPVIYHRHPQDSSHSQANWPSQLSMNDAQRNRMSKTMSCSLSFEKEVTPDMPEGEVHSCMTDHTCYSPVNGETPNRDAATLGQTSQLSFCLSEQNGSEFA